MSFSTTSVASDNVLVAYSYSSEQNQALIRQREEGGNGSKVYVQIQIQGLQLERFGNNHLEAMRACLPTYVPHEQKNDASDNIHACRSVAVSQTGRGQEANNLLLTGPGGHISFPTQDEERQEIHLLIATWCAKPAVTSYSQDDFSKTMRCCFEITGSTILCTSSATGVLKLRSEKVVNDSKCTYIPKEENFSLGSDISDIHAALVSFFLASFFLFQESF